jgi:uncharacterized cupredoxin-like copper-binding protein
MHRWANAKNVSIVVACAVAAIIAGCSEGDIDNATAVNVTLREFSVTPDRSTAPAGQVTFNVSNVGEDMHEFLVIKTDLAPNALPTESNGSYEEDGAGTDLLDEIEVIEPGNTADLSLDLDAGHYVLICNMVHVEDDGEVEVHYAMGMRTAFTVQ